MPEPTRIVLPAGVYEAAHRAHRTVPKAGVRWERLDAVVDAAVAALRALPVAERMEVMGMTLVGIHWGNEEVVVYDEASGRKTLETWFPDVEEYRDPQLFLDLAGWSFTEDRPDKVQG